MEDKFSKDGVGDGSGGNASDGERWGAAEETSLAHPRLTSCCATPFLTGLGPILGTPAIGERRQPSELFITILIHSGPTQCVTDYLKVDRKPSLNLLHWPNIENLKNTTKNQYKVLGCTLQAYKPYSGPALRLKKEPRDSNRDINGLLDRESLKGCWSRTLPVAADGGEDMAAGSAPWERRRLPFWEELMSGGLISYQGLIEPYNEKNWLLMWMNRDWSSWGCRESKITAIMNGLTILIFINYSQQIQLFLKF